VDISYPVRSKFLDACRIAILQSRVKPEPAQPVIVKLNEGGFGGKILVTICADDQKFFGSNWDGNDPTWFPARIRAAAWALKLCDYSGSFEISHMDGTLEIRSA